MKVLRWCRANIFPIICATIVTLGAVILVLPADYRYFAWETQYTGYTISLFGLLIFLLGVLKTIHYSIALCVAPFLGFGVGRIMRSLWYSGWVARVILTITIIVNLLFGTFTSLISGVYVEQVENVCERFFTETQGIQILVYREAAWPKGENYFFLVTHDGGLTWQQALYHRRDDPKFDSDSLCNNVKLVDKQIHQVWLDDRTGVTNDGGKTWQELESTMK